MTFVHTALHAFEPIPQLFLSSSHKRWNTACQDAERQKLNGAALYAAFAAAGVRLPDIL